MKKLDWLVGDWKGVSEINMGGKKNIVSMHESIKPQQNGTVLLITGLGTEKDSVVHDALAVVSFDPKTQTYRWNAWRSPGGYYSEVSVKVGDKSFEWETPVQGGRTRYKAILNEKGQWVETGEFSANGQQWFKFMTMTMSK